MNLMHIPNARIKTQFGHRQADGVGQTVPTKRRPIEPPSFSAEPVISFDYASIDPGLAIEARSAADRIRYRLRTTIFDTGRDLIAIKEKMPHGTFGAWINAEFGMTERTALNYMHGAKFLEGKSEKISVLPPAAIFALGAPSAPPEAVNDVIAAIEAGKKLRVEDIRNRLSQSLAAQRKADAAKSAEQIKQEQQAAKRRREVEAKRHQKWLEEQATADAAKTTQAQIVAKHLANTLGGNGVVELFGLLDGTDWNRVERCFRPFTGGRYHKKTAAEIDAEFGGKVAP